MYPQTFEQVAEQDGGPEAMQLAIRREVLAHVSHNPTVDVHALETVEKSNGK